MTTEKKQPASIMKQPNMDGFVNMNRFGSLGQYNNFKNKKQVHELKNRINNCGQIKNSNKIAMPIPNGDGTFHHIKLNFGVKVTTRFQPHQNKSPTEKIESPYSLINKNKV